MRTNAEQISARSGPQYAEWVRRSLEAAKREVERLEAELEGLGDEAEAAS